MNPVKDWAYLYSTPFKIRYVVASYFLRNCRNIIEIGGYKTPITEFLQHNYRQSISVDPLIEPLDNQKVKHIAKDYREVDFAPYMNEYGLVILGMELPWDEKLWELARRAKTIIIGYPVDWEKSKKLFEKIQDEVPLEITTQLTFDLSDNDFGDLSNSWPPRCIRKLVVARPLTPSEPDTYEKEDIDLQKYPNLTEKLSDLQSINDLGVLNIEFVTNFLLRDAKWSESHQADAESKYLGVGLLYYALVYILRAKLCVCLGSGGGFVPRMMKQGQRDLGIEDGKTILIDANMGPYGKPAWLSEDSFFRSQYSDIQLIFDTTQKAVENAEAKNWKIDYLHIDADHSHEGSLKDFEMYKKLVSPNGVITFHDTKPNNYPIVTCWKTLDDIRKQGHNVVDLPWLGAGTAIIQLARDCSELNTSENWQLKTPVAFFIYKRPDKTEKVFEAIRQAKPPKLLVVADAPKANVPEEVEKCMKTRAIIHKVDWDCEVITNYSETNLGCRDRVSSGLDWVFEQVEEAIILEDDCLPHPTFFRFCEELLERYRDNEQIMMISGTNLQFEHLRTNCSYYFSRYNHIWGWASWRRVWHFYDKKMESWSKIKNTNWLDCLLKDKRLVEFWSKTFERTYKGEIDTWDYQCRCPC
jgi:predicted O-methyltransferase YrrM